VRYLEENVAAADIVLDPRDLAGLAELGSAAGDRHPDMSTVNR
jgi:hypothetical protein